MEKLVKNYPNFFIVGAGKSGTSSLYEYLKQHPQIFMSEFKEPLFFVPPSEVKDHLYKSKENYLALFDKVDKEIAIGESSTPYLFYRESAKRIKNEIPEVKIIILLRNPVELAFSMYLHEIRTGAERLSFKNAIKVEKKRKNDPKFKLKSKTFHAGRYYISRAMLYSQVKNYLEINPGC